MSSLNPGWVVVAGLAAAVVRWILAGVVQLVAEVVVEGARWTLAGVVQLLEGAVEGEEHWTRAAEARAVVQGGRWMTAEAVASGLLLQVVVVQAVQKM